MIGRIEVGGEKFKRQIERFLGQVPKLDKALEKRMPWAANEMGKVVATKAKAWAPVRTGKLVSRIKHEVRTGGKHGTHAVFGIWDLPYAYVIDFGINSPMLVPAHQRTQTQAFGEPITPRRVDVGTFVRRTKFKGRDFLHRAYYDSFRAFFGIMNKAITDAEKEVDLGE